MNNLYLLLIFAVNHTREITITLGKDNTSYMSLLQKWWLKGLCIYRFEHVTECSPDTDKTTGAVYDSYISEWNNFHQNLFWHMLLLCHDISAFFTKKRRYWVEYYIKLCNINAEWEHVYMIKTDSIINDTSLAKRSARMLSRLCR